MKIAIVGAGVIGTAIARELAKYDVEIHLIEREAEACMGTSKANSAILHAGFDAIPGTKKARLNHRGNALYHEMAESLGIPLEPIGTLVVARRENELIALEELLARGKTNGIEGLALWDRAKLLEEEPQLSGDVLGALFAPSGGILCPFQATFAFLENAIDNGAFFHPNTQVLAIHKTEEGYQVLSDNGEFLVDTVINAAGVSAGHIASMLGDEIEIIPRKGQYRVLDKGEREKYHHVLFGLPEEHSKGVLITPTVHGNVLLGPTSEVMDDPYDTSTNLEGIHRVDAQVAKLIKPPDLKKTIRLFSGVRASHAGGDFIIEESLGSTGCIQVAAIDSPGLTAAPAIAQEVREILSSMCVLREKEHFQPIRKPFTKLRKDPKQRHRQIEENPEFGEIVCRCEEVSLAQVRESIRRVGGARTIGGVKRRVRPGSGRCQGGFCESRVLKVLREELGLSDEELRKEGRGSWMLKKPDV